MHKLIIALSCVVLTVTSLVAQYQLEVVASGLTQPVGVSHAGDARLFIIERAGRIKILHPNGQLGSASFLDITDRVLSTSGEQGLLGLAFDPAYASTGRFYVYYTTGNGGGILRLSRFQVSTDPDLALADSEEVLWQQAKTQTNHNGGCLRFGPDGYLYMAPGDGGGAGDPNDRSQDLGSAFGKMMRLDVSGPGYAVPDDNPFIGLNGALPEIWAMGLRNPWRFSFDRANGDLWIADVGQDMQEEIDRWPGGDHSGPNFGWRCYEGTVPYNTNGCGPASNYVDPAYVHGHGDGSCSISGGVVYRGTAFPALQGRYLYSDLCAGRVHALQPDGGGWTSSILLSTGAGGTVSVDEDVAGEVYFVRMNMGTVSRLIDASQSVQVAPRVILGGAFDETINLMRDDLRTGGHLPAAEPYTALGFAGVALSGGEEAEPGVLAIAGGNAIVDWVRVEIRSSVEPAKVLASRHGLLQRDGDVVATDGASPLSFTIGPGAHFVALRHRNHFGVMTEGPIALGGAPVAVDLIAPGSPVWGVDARKPIGGIMVLWPGNTRPDGIISYTGTANDRDPILEAIGGSVPTASVTGYSETDVDLNGITRYTGTANDRDIILQVIGGEVPTHFITEQIP